MFKSDSNNKNMWIIGIQLIPSMISGFWFKSLLKIDLQTIRKQVKTNMKSLYIYMMLIEQKKVYFGPIFNFGDS